VSVCERIFVEYRLFYRALLQKRPIITIVYRCEYEYPCVSV